MLTAEQRDTIRAARDAEARARAKRTRRIEDQLDLYADRDKEAEVTQETPQATEPSENGAAPEWTRETIVEAMLRWHDEQGSLPTSPQWQRRNEGYPTYDAVRKVFAGWPGAIAAANARLDRVVATEPDADPEDEARLGPDPELVLDQPPATRSALALLAEEYENAHEAVVAAEAHRDLALARFRNHPLVDLAFSDRA